MRKISILLAAILVLPPWIALAQTPGTEKPREEEATLDTSSVREPHKISRRNSMEVDDVGNPSALKRPKFPSEEEIAKITSQREVVGFPGISINIGGAISYRDNSDLDESFVNAETAFGTEYFTIFTGSRASCTFGLRWRFSRMFSLWWEYLYGGKPADNDFRVSSISFSLLYTLFPEKAISVSLGPGVETQRIRARKDYYFSLGDGGYLENIEIDTGQRWATPLIALLELRPSQTHPRYALFISARYVMGPTISETMTLGYNNLQSAFRIRMNGKRLAAGISIAL